MGDISDSQSWHHMILARECLPTLKTSRRTDTQISMLHRNFLQGHGTLLAREIQKFRQIKSMSIVTITVLLKNRTAGHSSRTTRGKVAAFLSLPLSCAHLRSWISFPEYGIKNLPYLTHYLPEYCFCHSLSLQ